MDSTAQRERLWWIAVVTIALAGLALRIAAARGALWTDEAWSAIYAAQARDALGVFLRINHDNNHHLMSLWLQAIGPAASPLLARAPSILAGSLCVVVAALFAGRLSKVAGIVAALLFAVSPILVVYGSEARGYAMMLLAALIMLLLVSDAVEGKEARWARWWLAALALLGMFSHLTMAAPVGIATLWVYLERRAQLGARKALPETLGLMGPALATAAGVVAFVFAAAALSATGMRVGGYDPFSASKYGGALNDLALWSAGLSTPWLWLLPCLVAVAALAIGVRRPDWLGSRALLYALLTLGVPLAVALLRPGNSSFARYYLASAIGLLLFMSEWIARGLRGRRPAQAGAALLVVAFLAAGLYRDSLAIMLDRGRPGGPVADMAAIAPSGARVAFDAPRLKAVVALATERTGYAARAADGCAPADFFLAAQSRSNSFATVDRCGVTMDAVDSSTIIPLTGDSWVLYRARNLPSAGAPVSGPAPKGVVSRLSGRAGVAQG